MQSRWISLHWLIEPHSLAANQPLEMLASLSYRHPPSCNRVGWDGAKSLGCQNRKWKLVAFFVYMHA